MKVLVAGCGWLGSAVADRLQAAGHEVWAVRRRPRDDAPGITAVAADLADARSIDALPEVDAVVATQAASGPDVTDYERAYVEINRRLVDWTRRHGERAFVYTGSTGVFGQHGGEDVDETTPPQPRRPTARILLRAEQLVAEAGGRVVRLSGLYGPGRFGVIERVRSGRLALGPGDDAWMNWCHREDAARCVVAALLRGSDGHVYHGSDACPSRRREVVEWIAARLGIEPPRGGQPSARGADRRILSERTRRELAIELTYPSFREGLAGAAFTAT